MALSIRKTLNDIASEGSTVGCLRLPKGVDLLKIEKAGPVQMVFLPYTVPEGAKHPYAKPGEQHFFRPYNIFHKLGITGKRSALDHHLTFGEKCAVTDFYANWEPSSPEDKKPRSQKKALFNLYLPEQEKVVVFDFSYAGFADKLFKAVELKMAAKNPATGALKYPDIEYFADPEYGYIVTCNFVEDSFAGRKFFEAGSFEFDKADGQFLTPEILGKAVALDDMLIKLPYASISAMVRGEDDDSDTEEVEVPAKQETAPPPPPAKVTKPAPKIEQPAPEVEAPKPTVAPKATTSPIKPKNFAVGDVAYHITYGKVTITKVKDEEKVIVEDSNEDLHTAHVSALMTAPPVTEDDVPFAVEEAPAPKAEKPKKTTKAPAKNADASGFDDWE